MMKKKHNDYQVVPYSKLRSALAFTLHSAQRKSMIHGLIEVDVTRAREFLREHKAKTGESLSFTAFIITCLARAVDENKAVQACRKGSKRLVLFDDVDVASAIERDMAGQKQPIVYIIRAANKKSFQEIHHEIRVAQVKAVEQAWEGFKGFTFMPLVVFRFVWPIFWWMMDRSPQVQDVAKASVRYQVFQFLPLVVFRFIWPLFWWMVGRSPQVLKKYRGTVGITAVGMFGAGAGWGIPSPSPTLMITVGGIGEKPGVVDGQIAIREYLSLTISCNHELIDGAPVARFIQRLKDLIESGYGLDNPTVGTKQAVAAGTAK